jgi:hypothetical protein
MSYFMYKASTSYHEFYQGRKGVFKSFTFAVYSALIFLFGYGYHVFTCDRERESPSEFRTPATGTGQTVFNLSNQEYDLSHLLVFLNLFCTQPKILMK